MRNCSSQKEDTRNEDNKKQKIKNPEMQKLEQEKEKDKELQRQNPSSRKEEEAKDLPNNIFSISKPRRNNRNAH